MWMLIDLFLFFVCYSSIQPCITSSRASQRVMVAIAAWLAFVTLPAYALSWINHLSMEGWLASHAVLALPGLARMGKRGVEPWRNACQRMASPARTYTSGYASAIFMAVILLISVLALITPPYDTDSLVYHLPRAALWLQESSTWVVTGVNARIDSMGLNGSLVIAWAMAFWPHAHAPGLIMVLFFMLAWVAMVDGLASSGMSMRFRMWAGLAVVAVPHVFNQVVGVGMDLIVISCILAFVALTFFSSPGSTSLLAGSVYLGFAVGAKGSVIPLVAFLGLALAWSLWRRAASIHAAAGHLLVVGAVSGSFVLPGWIQNAVLAGHPFGSPWLRIVTTDAGAQNMMRQARFVCDGFHTWFDVCSFLPLIAVPLLGIMCIRRQDATAAAKPRSLLLLMAAALVFQAWVTRSSDLSNYYRLALPTLALGLFVVPSCWRHGSLLAKAMLAAVLGFSSLLQVATVVGPFRQGLLVQQTDEGLKPGQLVASERIDFRHLEDEVSLISHYPYNDPDPVRVGFVGRGSSYFLFGKWLQHRVVYLNPSVIARDGVDQTMKQHGLDYLWSPTRSLEEKDMSGVDKRVFRGRSMNEVIEGEACTRYDLADAFGKSFGQVFPAPSGSAVLVKRVDPPD